MRFNKEWIIFASLAVLVLTLTFSDQIAQLWRRSRSDFGMPLEEKPPEDPNTRLIRLAKEMTLTPPPPGDSKEQAKAQLGRRLFLDPRFSATGTVSCASCHDPQRSFTDGMTLAHGVAVATANTPTIVNAFAGTWFMWDGRADSLASQALKPIENPFEHSLTRGRVAQLLWQHYRTEFEQTMGPFPAALTRLFATWGDRAFAAAPQAPELTLSLEVSAYAIATMSSSDLQQRFIMDADAANESPQRALGREALAPPPLNRTWAAQWNQLSAEQQQDINHVFASFGQALAAYERGIIANESPFDGYIARLRTDQPPEAALGDGFGDGELKGLRFFIEKECVACHNGPTLSDHQFHNIGLPQRGDEFDVGRARGVLLAAADPFNCTGDLLPRTESESCLELPFLDATNLELVGARKTPTLRNISETAPYMHDGRFETLDQVLDHYNSFAEEPALGHREETLKPLRMTSEERKHLTAFLRSLTAPVRDLTVPPPSEK